MGCSFGRDGYICEETFRDLERCLFLNHDEVDNAYVLFHRVSQAATEEQVRDAQEKGKAFGEPPKERFPHDPDVWEQGVLKLMRIEQFLCMSAFRNNIIAPRIFEVFQDQPEGMTFKAFLYLVSSFSHNAPTPVKCFVAMNVYSFHDEGKLSVDDVDLLVKVYSREVSLWDAPTTARRRTNPFPFHNAENDRAPNVVPWEEPFPQCPPLLAAEPSNPIPQKLSEKLFDSIDINHNDELSRDEFETFCLNIPDFRAKFSNDVLS